ncbi:hypothetical protein LPJ56_001654 [Coemansia sp. RSA 2599]|nr:hypothetical protein LPJ56_001654 [Coemansia sp. RSA 2599]
MSSSTNSRKVNHRSRMSSASGGRGSSWLRNNWTEAETREVMEILVAEFIVSDYTTAAYSKSHAPDARFSNLTFERPPRELYNKVQNLRQRFFTPHSYLLRWAAPNVDARSLKRAEKCLMNPKTRDSIHGIFAAFVPEAAAQYGVAVDAVVTAAVEGADDGGDGLGCAATGYGGCDGKDAASAAAAAAGSAIAVKSVNYYCDIFRRQAPGLWATSVEAYKRFLANRELQSSVVPPAESEGEQSDFAAGRRQNKQQMRGIGVGGSSVMLDMDSDMAQSALGSPPLSLASSSLQTPNSVLMTDFGSDVYSDATDDSAAHHEHMQLMAVVGHSWHKFLSLRSRWLSLGLDYASREDWQRKEAGFLAHHLLTLIPDYACDPAATVPLTFVPLFIGSFDATNIEMAVARARTVHSVTLGSLVDGLLRCLESIETKEPYTMLSLCWLTDRATHSRVSLALLISHGSSAQRFGVFPHNDSMFACMVAGSEGMWHQYTGLPATQQAPVTPQHGPEDSDAGKVAFAYSQSGVRYTFFARLRGHFFEMTRDEEWAPTMRPAVPRLLWNPSVVSRDVLLAVLHRDVEKILAGMVELFGLRLFCHGFFDGISSSRALPANPRRISDDPSYGASRRRHPSATASSSRPRRSRISAGAISSLGGGGGGSASPYRRPQSMNLSTSLSAAAAAAAASAAAAAAAGVASCSSNSGNVCSAAAAGAGLSATTAASGSLSRQPSHGSLASIGAGLFGHAKSNTSSGNTANISTLAASASAAAAAVAAAAAAQKQGMAMLSPQPRSYNSFPSSVDITTMSASLPNSPFFGLHMDNVAAAAATAQQAHHTPLLLQGQNNSLVAGSGTSHDGVQLFPSLNDAAFLAAAANTTPSIGLLHDPLLAASADGSADAGIASSSLSSSSSAAAAAAAVTAAAVASIDAGSLFSSAAVAGSPAFWDLSGSGLQHQMQQATLSTPVVSTINASPSAHAVAAAAAVAAAMGMNSINTTAAAGLGGAVAGMASGPSSASSTSTSVAIYPQAAHQTTMPVWDDVAAQTLTNVLGSPEMLMQFAQPSPTPTVSHYNLSAHPTPAFETCSAPPASGQFGTFADALATATTAAATAVPISSMAAMCSAGQSEAVMSSSSSVDEGGKIVSSMAAYFGTPGSDYNANTSPFIHDNNMPQARMFANNGAGLGISQGLPQQQQQQAQLSMAGTVFYPRDQNFPASNGC